jgi:hypothetical protein
MARRCARPWLFGLQHSSPCRHARESGHPGQATESRALVVTIDGGEWLQGAGQFNFRDRLTDAVWESLKPKKK